MTPAPPRQPWDDEAIDRVLRSALSVDPSPAFRARVRARLVDEPMPVAGRGARVWWGGAVAAASVLLAAVLGMPRGEQPPVAPPRAPVDVTQSLSSPGLAAGRTATLVPPPSTSPSPAAEALPVTTARAVGSRREAVRANRAVGARFDPRDREAFAWFLSLSGTGLLPEPASLASVSADQDLIVSPIVIPAIDVAPLDA